MIFRVSSLIVLMAFELCIAQELTLPVTTCHRNSADFSVCLKHAMQKAWPRFVQGLAEFNFPIIDPLFYDRQHATYDNGAIHADVDVTNIIAIGLMDMRFLVVRTHFVDDIFHLEVDCRMPRLFSKCSVQATGSLGPFTGNSTGKVNLTATDINVSWIITGHVADDRWTVEHFRAIPTITTMKINLSDFLNSKELNDLIDEFVNQYWPILYRTVAPTIIDTWDPWLAELANRLFSKVSFSKVFPI